MQVDLEAIDGEEAAEDAFLEAGAEHNDVVFFIHGRELGEERCGGKRDAGEKRNEGGQAVEQECCRFEIAGSEEPARGRGGEGARERRRVAFMGGGEKPGD